MTVCDTSIGEGAVVKVLVPLIVQDPRTSMFKNIPFTEPFVIDREDAFCDGPVTRRVAVLDFDPDRGALRPGARFQPPSSDKAEGSYKIPNIPSGIDMYNLSFEKAGVYNWWQEYGRSGVEDFIRVSVFATVLKTLYMFEEEDALGRPMPWGFDGRQLLIVPRAGYWANACYERHTHSIQFFTFHPSARWRSGQWIYTGLSSDIVAHETSHAILDGIAPDLFDSTTPQSLALHEAIADLTAVLVAFSSHALRQAVLQYDRNRGSIDGFNAFSSICEEFGMEVSRTRFGCAPVVHPLRALCNDKEMDEEGVEPDDPHALSEVLSGALYKGLMVRIHKDFKHRRAEEKGVPELSVSDAEEALVDGAGRFRRMIFRALDYLPPGELLFADYGRAIIAADRFSHPDDNQKREWLVDEFVGRKIVSDRKALSVETTFGELDHELQVIDLPTLVGTGEAAWRFADSNRELLRIPPDVSFVVRPRLDISRFRYDSGGGRSEKARECLFKVAWKQSEPCQLGYDSPNQCEIAVGTTLAISWERTPRVHALLTSDRSDRPEERRRQQEDRDLMLRGLIDKGLLRLRSEAVGPDGKESSSLVIADSTDGVMRVSGMVRMLHIVGKG